MTQNLISTRSDKQHFRKFVLPICTGLSMFLGLLLNSNAQNLIGTDLQWTFPAFDANLGMNEFYGTASGAYISPGDINGDGFTDFVRGLNTENPGLGFWINNGGETPSFTYSGDSPYGISTVGVGARIHPNLVDFDNNGTLDILAATNTGGIKVWLNSGTPNAPNYSDAPINLTDFTPTAGNHSADLTLYRTLEVADFNNDGLLDLLGSYIVTENNVNSSVTLMAINQGSPNEPYFPEVLTNPYGMDLSGFGVHPFYKANMTAYDHDGDGDLDVFGMTGTECQVFYIENTGTPNAPVYGAASLQFTISTYYNMTAVPFDVNNDGVMDMLAGQDIGRVFIMYNVQEGCTDVNACNYNPAANINDNSCEYSSCLGCTDPEANNYDPEATINDNSCVYLVLGCMDEAACNFNPEAEEEDWSCDYADFGFDCEGNCLGETISEQDLINQTYWSVSFVDCQDPYGNQEFSNEVISFNENGFIDFYYVDDQGQLSVNTDATEDIAWTVDGCEASIWFWTGYMMNGSLLLEGKGCLFIEPQETACMDESACNFNPESLINDFELCDYESCSGCTDESACNYDEAALISDFEICEYSFEFESNNDFIPLGQVGALIIGYGVIFTIEDDFVTEFPIYVESNTLEGLCLEPGCYYIGFDVPVGFENNSWTITLDGEAEISGDFGDLEDVYFSFGGETCPLGCTDEEADNYDFFASADDGSCLYNDFCISAQELSVDGEALVGDNTNAGGSLNEAGCFDDDDVVNSVWFQMEVPEGAFLIRTILSGSMDDSMMEVYENCSATESIACNDDEEDLESQVEFDCGELTPGEIIFIRIDGYDESIGTFTIVAESIEQNTEGCTDENAANYNACANVDDDSCQYEGCTDETAVNYDETASIDDGSCTYEGCTDETAANFNELATIDDGSCEYEGCTDENALNYDENATIDDGSCEYNCFEPTVLYELEGCNDNEEGFSINLGVLNTEMSGPFIISNNLNGDELLVTEDGDYAYGNFDEDQDVVIILTSTITPNCFVSSGILACPLSLNEEEKLVWNLYPNPASTVLNVSLDATSVDILNFYDSRGRLVESYQVNQNLMSINTSNWASGMYYVKALGDNYIATKTLIIQP